jgi:hypothetical protein
MVKPHLNQQIDLLGPMNIPMFDGKIILTSHRKYPDPQRFSLFFGSNKSPCRDQSPPQTVLHVRCQGVLRFSAGFASGACTAFATQWMHNVARREKKGRRGAREDRDREPGGLFVSYTYYIYIGYIGYIGYLYIYPIYRPLKYLKKVAICGAMCRFWDPPSTEKEATYRFDHQ